MILEWLFSDSKVKPMVLHLPTPMDHAAETAAYLNDVSKEEIILIALDDYLRKNLWSTKDEGAQIKIQRFKQLRGK